MLSRYWKTFVAVLGGNALYFLVFFSHLPPAARHSVDHLDWGLAVDFWICLAVYGVLTFLFPGRRAEPKK